MKLSLSPHFLNLEAGNSKFLERGRLTSLPWMIISVAVKLNQVIGAHVNKKPITCKKPGQITVTHLQNKSHPLYCYTPLTALLANCECILTHYTAIQRSYACEQFLIFSTKAHAQSWEEKRAAMAGRSLPQNRGSGAGTSQRRGGIFSPPDGFRIGRALHQLLPDPGVRGWGQELGDR